MVEGGVKKIAVHLTKESGRTVEQEAPGIYVPNWTTIVLTECVSYNYFGALWFIQKLTTSEEGLGSKLQLTLVNSSP